MVTTRPHRTLPSPGGRPLPLPGLAAGLLVLLAFLTTQGDLSTPPTQLPTSWVDVALIVAGGLAVAALVVLRRGGRALTLWLFAAVAVLTALSIAWSVAPDQTWEESGRTVAYLGAFAVGLALALARRGASRGAVMALALSTTALCAWALAVKVFDLNLYSQPIYGRLVAPFGYANATGLIGAMALPGLVWLASRRDAANRWGSALATAGIAIAVSVVALSYSRSAVAAALFAVVLPLFWVRARRRAVVTLALGLLGAVPIYLYALMDHNLSDDGPGAIDGDGVAHLHRAGAGLVLGLIIVAVVVALIAAAFALGRWLEAHPQPASRLRDFDRGLQGLVLLVPVLILLWLIFNARGFGEISYLWTKLTSANAAIGDQADRIFNATNSRSAYWRQALAIGDHHLLAGAGAGTFYPAFLHYSTALLTPPGEIAYEAHSYVLDAFASFGLIGAVLNLGLFLSWCRDGVRAVRARVTTLLSATERDARWALIGLVIAFGTSSALDQTWFFPGVAVPALAAAGWISGISRHRGSTPAQLATAGPTRPAVVPTRSLVTRPGAIIALTALAAVTLAVAWESLQPMRSVQSANASLTAQGQGNGPAALSDARAAVSQDPFSVGALSQLANVYRGFREPAREQAELVTATEKQSQNPQPFVQLGEYQLCHREDGAAALSFERAIALDVTDSGTQREGLAAAQAHQVPPSCSGTS